MLDLRYVTENLDAVRRALATRGAKAGAELDRMAELAAERRAGIQGVEALRAERNETSRALASIDKKSEAFQEARAAMKALGGRLKEREAALQAVEGELKELLLGVPNLPAEGVPPGKGEEDNPVLRTWGERPTYAFTPRDHVALGEGLGILDFERAARVHGARFTVLKGLGARLERGLMQMMLDTHVDEHGYTELWPPALVRDSALRGTGQLPKFGEDVFKVAREYAEDDDSERVELYLSPTAEVQVTNFHGGEILEADALPVTYCAYTPCFRSEAGSHGKDTRGLIRQHQFDKVELVHLAREEDGEAQLAILTGHAEKILQKLELHYRVVELCTGDLGFSARRTYDLEVWLPGQDAYREISSCSWFGDFQARRASLRYRPAPKQRPRLLHTLNGSALAVGRALVAVLEQHQQEDGTVRVPEALRPYLGGRDVIA
jgi:seryl-tRNA synthetase